MKILFAGRPHSRIIGLDTREAESIPGVVAVYTSKDVPVNEYGLQKKDQPVLCGPCETQDSTRLETDIVRFEGDQVAAIVAKNEK